MADQEHPARAAAHRSMDAVRRKAKDEWVALFADDGIVQDPVGPSPFDETGEGHRGHAAIGAFWDATIGSSESIEFEIRDSFAGGDECANVGTLIARLPGGQVMRVDGVFVYCVGPDGLLRSLRAFWEWDRTMATIGAGQ